MKSSIVALCLVAALPAFADTGFVQDVTWRKAGTSDQVAHALYVLRSGEAAQASRLLMVTPEGRRVVLTNRLTADGVMVTALRDEQSGWTASVTLDFGARRNTLQELFRTLDPDKITPETRMTISFASSGGAAFTHVMPYDAAPEQKFAKALMGSEAAAQVHAAIPADLQRELSFLTAALTDDVRGASFRPVVELLRTVLSDTETAAPVEANLGQRTRGSILTAADQLALLAEFPSVSTSDPLADR